MGDIAETIVEVLSVVLIGGEIQMVDPDVGGLLDTDGVASRGEDLGDLQVTEND